MPGRTDGDADCLSIFCCQVRRIRYSQLKIEAREPRKEGEHCKHSEGVCDCQTHGEERGDEGREHEEGTTPMCVAKRTDEEDARQAAEDGDGRQLGDQKVVHIQLFREGYEDGRADGQTGKGCGGQKGKEDVVLQLERQLLAFIAQPGRNGQEAKVFGDYGSAHDGSLVSKLQLFDWQHSVAWDRQRSVGGKHFGAKRNSGAAVSGESLPE
jgi:hypothetical protein